MSYLLVGLVTYLAIILGISIFAARYVRGSSRNFIIAGGTLPFLIVIFSEMEQAIDGNATFGVFNLSREFGFWSGLSIPIGLGLSLILAGLFFAKPLRDMKLLTISDFFRIKFGERIELLASILMAVSFSVLLAGNLAAVGHILYGLFDIGFMYAVIISFLFIFAYTYVGGFVSDVISDPIQVLTFIIGIAGALIIIMTDFGASAFLHPTAYSISQMTSPASGAIINWATILALGLGDIIAVDFVARILAARKTAYARRGCIIGGIGTIIIGSMFALFGIASMSLPMGGSGMMEILAQNFPVIIGVLVIGTIITASLSTADGALLGAASLLAKNIFHKESGKVKGRDPLLRYTRHFVLLIGVAGMFIAMRIPQPGILLTLAFDVVLCSLFASFVFGTYWVADRRAALFSMVGGAALRVVFFVLTPTVFGVPNTLLYFENSFLSADFDGWATIIPFCVNMLSYAAVAFASKARR